MQSSGISILATSVLAAALLVPVSPVHAQTVASGQLDKPVSVRKLPPKSKEDSAEIICTYYKDVMVRETQDGPSSENAEIVEGANPPCTPDNPARATTIATEGMSLDGRKGKVLFFSDLDPHGAVGFALVNAETGRLIFRDGTTGSPGIQSIAPGKNGLHLRYQRAVNASCSLMENAARCWAQLAKQGRLPAALAKQPPSGEICAEAYSKAKAPKDNPSIVIYSAEIAVSDDGNITEISRGPVSCDSLP